MKSPKGILIVLIVVACSLLLAAPALATTQLNKLREAGVTLINKERAKHGLAQLRVNTKLTESARGHSAEMGEHKYFAHTSPERRDWSSRIVRYGYTRSGLRLLEGRREHLLRRRCCTRAPSPRRRVDGSKSHRDVILTKVFRDIGVGAVKTETGYGDIDGTVWFFTLDLGRRIR